MMFLQNLPQFTPPNQQSTIEASKINEGMGKGC
jgi:hypothetical protein